MTPEQMKIACVGLRSGTYVQTRYSIGSGNHTCAIGATGQANGLKGEYTNDYVHALDISHIQVDLLLNWNDTEKLTFPQIADRIETHSEFLGGVV